MRDLTEWPPDGWARYYAPGPAFIVSEDEYLELLDELERNESAYTAAQAYEAFDTFLKESIAAYFFHNNSAANVDQRADTWLRGQGLTPVDEQYWTSYVRIPSTTTRL